MGTGTTHRPYPSFSVVLETENLAQADLAGLSQSLACLTAQEPSPQQAQEVLLIDSGDTPAELLEQLCRHYPWLQVLPVPTGVNYYQAKMLGAEAATGDIVVYYDSDCLYEPHWLGTMLESFGQDPEVQVVAGETRTRGMGLYGTAMAIAYIFPQYSGQTTLQSSDQYFLNNVAFRREFLLAHPIPTDLPLYRGNCVVHARQLITQGYPIWRQPQARATHAPPNGLTHFFWRFLLIGYDYYWQKRLLDRLVRPLRTEASTGPARASVQNQESASPTEGWAEKWGIFRDRLQKLIATDWRHAIFLPLSIPVILVSALLISFGYWITARRPSYLVDLYEKWAIET